MSFLSSPSRTRGHLLPPPHREVSSQPPPAPWPPSRPVRPPAPLVVSHGRQTSGEARTGPGAEARGDPPGRGDMTLFATAYWPLRRSLGPRPPILQAHPAMATGEADGRRQHRRRSTCGRRRDRKAELRGGEVPEDPFAGQPPVVEPRQCHALHRLEGRRGPRQACTQQVARARPALSVPHEPAGSAAHVTGCGGRGCVSRSGRARSRGRQAGSGRSAGRQRPAPGARAARPCLAGPRPRRGPGRLRRIGTWFESNTRPPPQAGHDHQGPRTI